MGKRKRYLHKALKKHPNSAVIVGPVNKDLSCSQDEDVCEVEWDSPKPFAGSLMSDITKHLSKNSTISLSSTPIQRQSNNATKDVEADCTPAKAPVFRLTRHKNAGSVPFNRAKLDKLIAAINECKSQSVNVEQHACVCDTEVASSAVATVNKSCEELWTDTEDDSFVRVTQALLDAQSPELCLKTPLSMPCVVSGAELNESGTYSSTPIIKPPRVTRRTFALESVLPNDGGVAKSRQIAALNQERQPCDFTAISPQDKRQLPAVSKSNVVVKNVLVTLDEPDNGVNVRPRAGPQPPASTACDVMKPASTAVDSLSANAAVNHESFLDENDPFESPDLFAAIAEAELMATQCKDLFTAQILVDPDENAKKAPSAKHNIACAMPREQKQIECSATAKIAGKCFETFEGKAVQGKQGMALPLTKTSATSENHTKIQSANNSQQKASQQTVSQARCPLKRQCSTEEIEMKRLEAIKKRSQTLDRGAKH